MPNYKSYLLALLILWILIITKSISFPTAFAHYQTLSDSSSNVLLFRDDFDGSSLKTNTWQVYDNNSIVDVSSGFVSLSNPSRMTTFPYIHTKSNPFPQTDCFTVKVGIQYTSVHGHGTGLVVDDNLPVNGTPGSGFGTTVYGIWQDSSSLGYRISTWQEEISQQTAPHLDYHEIEFRWLENSDEIYVDGQRTRTLNRSQDTPRPTVLWFGNPVVPGPSTEWTSLKIDYIEVDTISCEQSSNGFETMFVTTVSANNSIYAFPLSDQPNEGQYIGIGELAAVADFDNDQFCEVISVTDTDRNLRLYETIKDSASVETIISNDAYPSSDFVLWNGDVATGDFDSNGFSDFAFSGRRCPSSNPYCPPGSDDLIQLHLNQGDLSFERVSLSVDNVLSRQYETIIGLDDGDFNKDGKLDLAAQHYWNEPTNDTHILFGNGDGSFIDQTVFQTTNPARAQGGVPSVVAGDFNSDGQLDLIVGQDDDGDTGQTWLYIGRTAGGFEFSGEAYDTNPNHEASLTAAGSGIADSYDFDGDGNLDVVATAWQIGILLFKGNGDGTFQEAINLSSNTDFSTISVPSLNRSRCRWQTSSVSDKTPLIFIPGVMGSHLRISGTTNNLWPGLPWGTDHELLSLAPGEQEDIIANDVIRTAYGDKYSPLIFYLIDGGYREYFVDDIVSRRTYNGCDLTQRDRIPSLFIFAYDWRKSNADSAEELEEYIRCIHRFYPESQVDIVAHSMGGLVARRYILNESQAKNNHYINKLITIGTPWLGAPAALHRLETGQLGNTNILVSPNEIKRLLEFFPGAHELLPSATYFDITESPFIETGWDIDEDGLIAETYDYQNMLDLLNNRYPRERTCIDPLLCKAGDNNQYFHSYPGQDVWNEIASDIDVHYIVGARQKVDTLKRVVAGQIISCGLALQPEACPVTDRFFVQYTRGDGTVPLSSAERTVIGDTPEDNITIHLISPTDGISGRNDADADHLGMTKNPYVQDLIIELLSPDTSIQSVSLGEATAPEPAFYINVFGGQAAMVTNSANEVTGIVSDTLLTNNAEDITFNILGDDSFSAVIPLQSVYTVTFQSGVSSMFIEIMKGLPDDMNNTVRYRDLSLPPNSMTRLVLAEGEIQPLTYDGDGDGSPETVVNPTALGEDIKANDMQPPTITVNIEYIGFTANITLDAVDNIGVAEIKYSTDGINFQRYEDPFSVDARTDTTVYIFGDDIVANRSDLVEYSISAVQFDTLFLPLIRN